ncbi:Sensory/regulatory protein RpfC [Rubripirellula lacrimiformis]|uniref:Sensory/regulatory protein RpfC n=1 Tax=Rubripirellula lacrimiformis TaxID=1930273 RepID=A0A517ND25_9BACT|nr:response regulator [Rubripirellula lacrimiformis]QDT04958.1 Sensory/regulatory protein RpfC [Rubripirellula lacrimiformis]
MNSKAIVVVDDEETDRFLMRRLFDRSGVEADFIEFENGDRFVDAITPSGAGSADLLEKYSAVYVFLDINMPGMSGFDVIGEIERLINFGTFTSQHVPVLVWSSSSNPTDRMNALASSCVSAYVVKPNNMREAETLFLHHVT